jgi:hypothetical protein
MPRYLNFSTQAAAQAAATTILSRTNTFLTANGYAANGAGGVVGLNPETHLPVITGPALSKWSTERSSSGWLITHPIAHSLSRLTDAATKRSFADFALEGVSGYTETGSFNTDRLTEQTAANWRKWPQNPLIGGSLVYFDAYVIQDGGVYKMWMSRRDNGRISYATSTDRVKWSTPVDVLVPIAGESLIKSPIVVKRGTTYHMFFTGQDGTTAAWVNYATSPDGVTWARVANHVLDPVAATWESVAVGSGGVIWDATASLWRMWYAGGAETYEPDAVGYATSPDGVTWTRPQSTPVMSPDADLLWEAARLAAGSVVQANGYFYLFYIGYRDVNEGSINVARSMDGITWKRHPLNPIIRKGQANTDWDRDSVYRPSALFEGSQWSVWYNGRIATPEQIGLAYLPSADLMF